MLKLSNIKNINAFLYYIKSLQDNPMLIFQNRTFSYADIYYYTLSTANWLNRCNVKKIMFSIDNSPLLVALFFASWQQKLKCIPVNPRFIDHELISLLKRSLPEILVIESRQYSNQLDSYCKIHQINLIILDSHIDFLKQLETNDSICLENLTTKYDEGITYHISSGTNGLLNLHGHYTNQILLYAYKRQFDYGLKKGDLSLVSLSFNHAYAFSYQFLPNLALGNCMIFSREFKPVITLRLIEKYHITALALLPTMYYQIVSEYNKSAIKHQLRHLSVAGDQPTADLMNLVMLTFKVPLLNGIGMTETYGYAQNLIESTVYNRTRVFDDIQVKIKSHNNAISHEHIFPHAGEIYIQTFMKPVSQKGNWMATGDYGYIDKKHHLYFLGRIKDIIVKNGSKISPLELEHYLLKHDLIEQAVVLGKKNSFHGEIICACISTKNNKVVTLSEVNSFLTLYLAKYKHIDKLFFHLKIPLNITGKVDRLQLKKEIENA